MTPSPSMARVAGVVGRSRRAQGFTLIEVLVVVAIIALLVAILIPSLTKARESARSALCLSNQSQMGKATMMYINDHKSTLPGPLHNPVYHKSGIFLEAERLFNSSKSMILSRSFLPLLISKHLGDKSNRGNLADEVSACPTAEKINKAERQEVNLSSLASAIASLGSGMYVVNSGHDRTQERTLPSHKWAYGATKPRNYFGVAPTVTTSWTEYNNPSNTSYGGLDGRKPKKIEVVPRPADEWMMADLWWWAPSGGGGPFGGGTARQYGTWVTTAKTNSITNSAGQLTIPSYPYHNTTREFSPTAENDNSADSPRLTSGRTNTVFMDGHAASVYRWQGTVNPDLLP